MDSHKEYSAKGSGVRVRPDYAPRCFGLGSMFGADASICGKCSAHDECLPLAKLSLAKTNEVIGENNVAVMHVSMRIEETKKISTQLKAEPLPKINGVSKAKLSSLVNQITASNPCFADYLNSSRNPFSVATKPAYLKPLVDHMLLIDSSDEGLTEFLINVFEKPRKEAEQLVQLVKAAFEILGFTI